MCINTLRRTISDAGCFLFWHFGHHKIFWPQRRSAIGLPRVAARRHRPKASHPSIKTLLDFGRRYIYEREIPYLFAGSRPGFLPIFPKIAACGFSPRDLSSADCVCQRSPSPEFQVNDGNSGGNNMASGTIALEGAPADYSIWRVILASWSAR